MKRIIYLLLCVVVVSCSKKQEPKNTIQQELVDVESKYKKDFDYLMNNFELFYAYFDQKQTNWKKVREIYQPQVDKITEDWEFTALLEKVIYELYDPHISLNVNLKNSFRLIPTNSDTWIKLRDGKYFIEDIRPNYETKKQGVKIGSQVLLINGKKIDDLVNEQLPKSFKNPKDDVKEFFANLLFAGKHNAQRDLLLKENGKERLYKLGKPIAIVNKEELISSKILDGNIGYIQLNNSLGNNKVIKTFPKIVDEFKNTKAIIIDLRNTPSGGNAEVAKTIMGKFVTKTIPYQKHEKVSLEREFGIKRSWIELLSPLENPYKKPVVVLVGRWTGSVGEAIAQGFDNIETAKVVGTEMAKLLGAINCTRLPNTNINVCYPVEKLFHVNGTPRENFIPEYKTKSNKETYNKGLELTSKL